MNIALVYGFFSSQLRGPYNTREIWSQDLTGSESFFFNMAHGLAESGNHVVHAYGDWTESWDPTPNFRFIRLAARATDTSLLRKQLATPDSGYDAAISWNEPDYLEVFPENTFRICVQQLNDFSYCKPGYEQNVDLFLFPSDTHRNFMLSTNSGIERGKTDVLSNCIGYSDGTLVAEVTRDSNRLMFCSSPDRGLHWALLLFAKARRLNPKLELHVYYRYDPWYQAYRNSWAPENKLLHEFGLRARYCHEAFNRLGRSGERGLFLHGPVPGKDIVHAFRSSGALLYPCDPVVFTEGFGVSVLDACSNGAVPIVSDADAFGEVYGSSAVVIPGKPGEHQGAWIDAIARATQDDTFRQTTTTKCKQLAGRYSRASRVSELERLVSKYNGH